jgi:hypothetical protein
MYSRLIRCMSKQRWHSYLTSFSICWSLCRMTYSEPSHDPETWSINCCVRRTPVLARLAATAHTAISSFSVIKTCRRQFSDESVKLYWTSSINFTPKQPPFSELHFNIILHWRVRLPYDRPPWRIPTEIFYAYLLFPLCTTYIHFSPHPLPFITIPTSYLVKHNL